MGDQASSGLLSPLLQRRRIERALPLLRGRILDYGCGNGALYSRLSNEHRRDYVGYDPDAEVVEAAHRGFPEARFTARADDLPTEFDSIVSLAVVEHVPAVGEYLAMLRSFLAPAGKIVLTSPRSSIDRVHRLGGAIGIFSREANEEHNEYVSESSIVGYCAQVGLELERSESFLLGANQLFVLREATRAASAA